MATIEIQSLSQVLQHLKRDSLLLVDIDDTLIRATGPKYNCPNAIFRQRMKSFPARYTKDGKFMSYFNKDYLAIVKEFNENVRAATFTDIEFSSSHFNRWKDRTRGRVVGITARGIELRKETEAALIQNHIYFPITDIEICNCHKSSLPHSRGGISPTRNIIYAGGYDKGSALLDYLGMFDMGDVVMVDDSLLGLKQVESAVSGGSYKFTGLHYVS